MRLWALQILGSADTGTDNIAFAAFASQDNIGLLGPFGSFGQALLAASDWVPFDPFGLRSSVPFDLRSSAPFGQAPFDQDSYVPSFDQA